MDIKVKVRELKELVRRTKNEKLNQDIRFKDDNVSVDIPVENLKPGDVEKLFEIVEERIKTAPQDRYTKWVRGRLRSFIDLRDKQIDDHTVIKKLEQLALALKKYLEAHAPHRWVFSEGSDHISLPYFVTNIQFYKRKRDRSGNVEPAHVTLYGQAYKHGSTTSESWTWSEDHFPPKTISQLFADKEVQVETPAAAKEYLEEHVEAYGKYQNACGQQMLAVGDGLTIKGGRWGSWGTIAMVRDGQATRVVLDPNTEELNEGRHRNENSRIVSTQLWDTVPDRNGLSVPAPNEKNIDSDEDEFTDDDGKIEATIEVALPIHPYLYVFDLDKHRWVDIHVANLQEYPWDEALLDKLILPNAQKNLLHVLMSTTGQNVGDIIRGKMSGVIVLATGLPGTGKTLTAEVFSEFIKKPLYVVQCSQLGLDVKTIEEALQNVLNRASRWGAVLLIDEADVYIRRRGDDIMQNAIVGVFLRLLEYYRGILFMTSNRGEIIDDAILSRATAWVKYELPDDELLRRIWRMLAEQYKVKLRDQDGDVDTLVQRLPGISGRSVRNILKLATLLKGSKATTKDLLAMATYQALEKEQS